MTPRATIKVKASDHVAGLCGLHCAAVTLPAPPEGLGISFDFDPRPETAPRSKRITGDKDWTRDPVLRHANKRTDRG